MPSFDENGADVPDIRSTDDPLALFGVLRSGIRNIDDRRVGLSWLIRLMPKDESLLNSQSSVLELVFQRTGMPSRSENGDGLAGV